MLSRAQATSVSPATLRTPAHTGHAGAPVAASIGPPVMVNSTVMDAWEKFRVAPIVAVTMQVPGCWTVMVGVSRSLVQRLVELLCVVKVYDPPPGGFGGGGRFMTPGKVSTWKVVVSGFHSVGVGGLEGAGGGGGGSTKVKVWVADPDPQSSVAAAVAVTTHVPAVEAVIAPVTEFTVQSLVDDGLTVYVMSPASDGVGGRTTVAAAGVIVVVPLSVTSAVFGLQFTTCEAV